MDQTVAEFDNSLVVSEPNQSFSSNNPILEESASLLIIDEFGSSSCSLLVLSDDQLGSEPGSHGDVYQLSPLRQSQSGFSLSSPGSASLYEEPLHHSTPTKNNNLLKRTGGNVCSILQYHCCSERCLARFTLFEAEDVRERFFSKNTSQQNQFLLDSFMITSSASNSVSPSSLLIEGKSVCCSAFMALLGISSKRFKKIFGQSRSGVVNISRKQTMRDNSLKTTEAIAWMSSYFSLIGDKMPHKDQTHLPHFLTKSDIYDKMKGELRDEGVSPERVISRSHFYRLWNQEFKKVVIPERSLFSKCDLCTKYNQVRLKKSHTGYEKDFQDHIKLVELERKQYYSHRQKARSNPEKYLTVIIDGMDQNKTNIPQLLSIPKSIQKLATLKTHLTGVLVHTRCPDGKLAFAFYDLMQWPHDCNIVIQVLLEILVAVQESFTRRPTTLYLQMDNCARENKNQYFLAFLALLVEKRVFKKIKLNFLPVGHTHEDIDQLFSRVSTRLKQKGAECLTDLRRETMLSSSPSPDVRILQSVTDVKSWLVPQMNRLNGHKQPHCFKFTYDEEAKCTKMYVRMWSKSVEDKDHKSLPWSSDEDASVLLKNPVIGQPQQVVPCTNYVDLEKLKESIPKYKTWVSSESWKEWEELNEKLEDIFCNGQIQQAPWLLESITGTRSDRSPPDEQDKPTDPSLEQLFAAERAECEVYTGPYRPKRISKRAVQSVNDLAALKTDQLVAVFADNCDLEPLIAKVVSVSDDEVDIVWMEGGYTTSWKTAYTTDRGKRKKIEWRDTIPKTSIILFDFTLTSNKHLRKKTVEHLKSTYLELKD